MFSEHFVVTPASKVSKQLIGGKTNGNEAHSGESARSRIYLFVPFFPEARRNNEIKSSLPCQTDTDSCTNVSAGEEATDAPDLSSRI